MGWFGFGRERRPEVTLEQLMGALVQAVEASDERAFDTLCRENEKRVRRELYAQRSGVGRARLDDATRWQLSRVRGLFELWLARERSGGKSSFTLRGPEPHRVDTPLDLAAEGGLHEAIGDFGLAVLRRARGNVVCSPFSIFDAWIRIWAGASGETRAELERALAIRRDDAQIREDLEELTVALTGSEIVDVRSASAVWMRPGYALRAEYEQRWGEGVETLDFSDASRAAAILNRWVSKHTNGRIASIVEPESLGPQTAMMVANAVYLKAMWCEWFERFSTHSRTFTLLSGEPVPVPMMHHRGSYSCASHEDYLVLEKPYVGGNLSFVVVLPRSTCFEKVQASITWPSIQGALAASKKADVVLALPKFRITARSSVDGLLRELGVACVYDANASDLTGISPDAREPGRELFVRGTVHEAKIDVDEQGTEAVATTMVEAAVRATSEPPLPPFEFTVDRPFLFFVIERRTRTPIFSGQVLDPR